jgi:hypothetical protein
VPIPLCRRYAHQRAVRMDVWWDRGRLGAQTSAPGPERCLQLSFPSNRIVQVLASGRWGQSTHIKSSAPQGAVRGTLHAMDVTQAIKTLLREQRELDEQIKSITERKAQIDITISVLNSVSDEAERASRSPQTNKVKVQGGSDEAVVTSSSGRDAGPQATLRRLMRGRPGQVLDSKSAYALLETEGWRSTSDDPVNVVRSALAALAASGEVVKQGRGKYVYNPEQHERPLGQVAPVTRPTEQLNLTA